MMNIHVGWLKRGLTIHILVPTAECSTGIVHFSCNISPIICMDFWSDLGRWLIWKTVGYFKNPWTISVLSSMLNANSQSIKMSSTSFPNLQFPPCSVIIPSFKIILLRPWKISSKSRPLASHCVDSTNVPSTNLAAFMRTVQVAESKPVNLDTIAGSCTRN